MTDERDQKKLKTESILNESTVNLTTTSTTIPGAFIDEKEALLFIEKQGK